MFDKPSNDSEWAAEKGILVRCPKHGIFHDPNIECKECKKERSREALKNVVWPPGFKIE